MNTFTKKSLVSFSLFIFLHILSISPSLAGLVRSGDKSENLSNTKTKLFVFGDSYADTGNSNESIASSWKLPYGITFPGESTGRFSDGRILTDYIASHIDITSPVAYERRNDSKKLQQFGMNFAYGGTGVFDTDVSQPNMTLQIDLFHNIIKEANNDVYTKDDLQSSVALVSLAGNDYSNYLNHPPNSSLEAFTKSVVNQLVMDLQRIKNLGVPKVFVTAMEPLGCLPAITSVLGYKKCSDSVNNVSLLHNQLLQTSVQSLNKNTTKPTFFILDLYGAFLSVLKGHKGGGSIDQNRLKPCCRGIAGEFGCGSKDGNRTQYTVCNKPELAFFWDTVHPTQYGWYQVYRIIGPSLTGLI